MKFHWLQLATLTVSAYAPLPLFASKLIVSPSSRWEGVVEMAPLALAAGSSVTGLTSTTLSGQKLPTSRVRTGARCPATRLPAISAKYGEKSVYFDLDDIANTTGNWDLYGSDGPSPYNGLQSKFFETFGGAFTKRGLLLKFLLLGGGGTLAYLSSSASGDILAIKRGPQQAPKPGPGGKL